MGVGLAGATSPPPPGRRSSPRFAPGPWTPPPPPASPPWSSRGAARSRPIWRSGWSGSSSKAAAAEHAAAEAAKPKLPAPAQYLALEPPFVVNLNGATGGPQYLQVEIQLMTRDAVALSDLERHAPAIRARLLMLLAQQDAQGIADRAGKEKLQAQALAEVRKLMRAETGKPGVEDLLFTSFVTQ